jgi:hypothetical protein
VLSTATAGEASNAALAPAIMLRRRMPLTLLFTPLVLSELHGPAIGGYSAACLKLWA